MTTTPKCRISQNPLDNQSVAFPVVMVNGVVYPLMPPFRWKRKHQPPHVIEAARRMSVEVGDILRFNEEYAWTGAIGDLVPPGSETIPSVVFVSSKAFHVVKTALSVEAIKDAKAMKASWPRGDKRWDYIETSGGAGRTYCNGDWHIYSHAGRFFTESPVACPWKHYGHACSSFWAKKPVNDEQSGVLWMLLERSLPAHARPPELRIMEALHDREDLGLLETLYEMCALELGLKEVGAWDTPREALSEEVLKKFRRLEAKEP